MKHYDEDERRRLHDILLAMAGEAYVQSIGSMGDRINGELTKLRYPNEKRGLISKYTLKHPYLEGITHVVTVTVRWEEEHAV